MNRVRAGRVAPAGFVKLLMLGAVLAAALGATSWGPRALARGAQQQPAVDGLAPEGVAQIEALLREKETRSPVERKIDSQLLYARRMQQGLPVAPGVQTLDVDLPYASDGHVVVDVKADVTAGLLAQLSGLTGELLKTGPSDLQLHLDLDQIEVIAARPEVLFVQPRQGAITSRVDAPPAGRLTAGPSRIGAPSAEDRLKARALRRAAAISSVRRAMAERTTDAIGTGQGAVTSQADIVHRAAVFRGLTGATGVAVKIGVLSDGVTHLADAQASGDLGTVTVLPGQTGDGDEGTAMLELIHDIAPDAQLYFATAFTSIASFAQNIRDLRAAGCDIIVDDVFYFVETPFQDGQTPGVVSTTNAGIVIQAVKDVTFDGAFYFSSAGNSGNVDNGTSGVWEGDFVLGGATGAPVPAGSAGNFHRFTGAQDFDTLLAPAPGTNVPLSLYWSDPLGGSANDYDLFRLSSDGTVVLSGSTNIQDGNDDPYEAITQDNANPRIVVVKKTGAAGRYLHLNSNGGRLSVLTAGQTHGHNSTSAPYSFGVAAVNAGASYPNPFSTSNGIEPFSSDGPRKVFFLGDGTPITPGNVSSSGGTVLQKPDMTAADGVQVTGAGNFPGTFFGTSAAAPNAAGIMALFKAQTPGFDQAQLKSLLLSTALDIGAPGIDRDSGAGIVMARAPQPACSFGISPVFATFEAAGGSRNFLALPSAQSCNWATWSTVSWLTVSGNATGTGTASRDYIVAPNPGPARSGTIMIQGGQTFRVDQLGNPAARFDNVTPLAIPEFGTVESPLTVSGLTQAVKNVTVSLYLTHTFDSDITISLIGPDGTSVTLSARNGGSADNYGSACTPSSSRTTFDDSAAPLITHAAAPYVGSFRPEQPLSRFNGKAASGTWKLRINDAFMEDSGTLQCWSLDINQTTPPNPSNLAVFRPSSGRWFFSDVAPIDFGIAGDMPVPGDYNGDGIRDVAVFRPSIGRWYVRGGASVDWGAPGDIPVPADYDGDHITDMAVFRPSTGMFFIRNVGSVAWGLAGDLPVVADYNGDGLADVAVYRPSTGTWYIRNVTTEVFGLAADIPVPADYDGNGVADIAVFRPATGTWMVKDQYVQAWGLPGDVPVPMDRDGDNHAELGVFRRATGTWYFKSHVTDANETALWGAPGDIPLGRSLPPVQTLWGDYDGDRKADLTVFRPSTGDWVSLRSVNSMTDYTVRTWGLSSDVPAGGDYDGDGKIDPTVFRPSTGRWFVLLSSTNYSSYVVQEWGLSSDTPVPGDYDGDGKADFAVFRASLGRWVILLSSTGNTSYAQHDGGVSGDIPVPADYDGDGVTDLGLFNTSSGLWHIFNRITGSSITQDWGASGDVPAAADFDGDGRADLAVFRPSLGRWFIRSSIDGSYTIADWGLSGDVLVPADYDADGKADIAVFRPSDGTWYVRGLFNRSWGLVGDIPVLKNP